MEIEVAVTFMTFVSSSHTNQKLEPIYDLHCCLSLKIPVGRYLINVKDKHFKKFDFNDHSNQFCCVQF